MTDRPRRPCRRRRETRPCAQRSRPTRTGPKVVMLEAAPFEERGGNSHYTGGAFRFAYSGPEDLRQISPGLATRRAREHRFRLLFRGAVFRRHVRTHRVSNRSGALRNTGPIEPRNREMDGSAMASSCTRAWGGRPTRSKASSSSGAASRCISGGGGAEMLKALYAQQSNAASRSTTKRPSSS